VCRLIFCLFIFLAFSCKVKNPELSDIKDDPIKADNNLVVLRSSFGVVNVDRLRFRADNDLYSKTLRYLDRGDIVEILFKDNNPVKVGDIENYWYRVRIDKQQGWVYGYYIDLFPNFQASRIASDNYRKSSSSASSMQGVFNEELPEKLFFINNGELCYITELKDRVINRIDTDDIKVLNYYFSRFSEKIYFIGYIPKKSHVYDGGFSLYSIDYSGLMKPELIEKNILNAIYDLEENRFIIVSSQKISGQNTWVLSYLLIKDKEFERQRIVNIPTEQVDKRLDTDPLSSTLFYTYGSFTDISVNNAAKYISFKPPEANQSYIVSLLNLKWITVDQSKQSDFMLDNYRAITLQPIDNLKGGSNYQVILEDKFTGMTKELFISRAYPISASFSSNKQFVALTMIDTTTQTGDNVYPTSIALVSLNSYITVQAVENGRFYLPKWSK